jgi:hypothetical protein
MPKTPTAGSQQSRRGPPFLMNFDWIQSNAMDKLPYSASTTKSPTSLVV